MDPKPPSIDTLLRSPRMKAWEKRLPHAVRSELIRRLVNKAKETGHFGSLEDQVEAGFDEALGPGISRVINATGIVLHTNLGRAPLSRASLEKMARELSGYCDVEFDRHTQRRGSRTKKVEEGLTALFQCEAALVVNNNAAAVFLVLHALSREYEVLVSRGELVQIGGGFRVNEICEASGAIMVEVGSTNMTVLRDYERALTERTRLILKVHPSNFVMTGHVETVTEKTLAQFSKQHQIPFFWDLGSVPVNSNGSLDAHSVSKVGASVISFSADKLFGGPQGGILLGEKRLIERMKESPLYRTLRLSKVDLFLMEDAIQTHLKGELTEAQRMVALSPDELKSRIHKFKAELKVPATLVSATGSVGGGAMPETVLNETLIRIEGEGMGRRMEKLLEGNPPVVTRVDKEAVLIDLRTVPLSEEPLLLKRLHEVWECQS